jgi:GWxTD domain-containing protein
LAAGAGAFAQVSNGFSGTPVGSTGPLPFVADFHQFKGRADSTVVEIDLGLALTADSARSGLPCVLFLELDADAPGKGSILSILERKSVPSDSLRRGEPVYWLHALKLNVRSDSLFLRLAVRDSASGLRGEIRKRVAVRQYLDSLSISDLFLSSRIQRGSEKNEFEKRGAVLLPNPSRIFREPEESTNFYVYFEAYGMSVGEKASSAYSVAVRVQDAAGKSVWASDKTGIQKTGASFARIEKIPLTGLEAGLYRVLVEVADEGNGERAASGRSFRIASERQAPVPPLPMTDADVRKYKDQLMYIATEGEKKLFSKLDPTGKRQFLLNFWKSRDPSPETAENEFMVDYFKRLAYCEGHFKGGLRSDMARIYMIYGPPVDIQRKVDLQAYGKPVEIWTYGVNGRSEFVFVDRIGDGRYIMVHSTHPDELRNANWEKELK